MEKYKFREIDNSTNIMVRAEVEGTLQNPSIGYITYLTSKISENTWKQKEVLYKGKSLKEAIQVFDTYGIPELEETAKVESILETLKQKYIGQNVRLFYNGSLYFYEQPSNLPSKVVTIEDVCHEEGSVSWMDETYEEEQYYLCFNGGYCYL